MLTQSRGGGQCCRGASTESVCRCDVPRPWSGKRLGTFSQEIMSKAVCDGLVPDRERSEPGRRAWSKLHYQEYLGERISVNPNRYKDFCVFALSQIYWKPFASASIFRVLFLVFIFEVPCLLNSCGIPPFLCPSPPHPTPLHPTLPYPTLFLSVFKALSQTMETGDLGRGKCMVFSDLLLRGIHYQQAEIICGKRDVINKH